MLTLSAINTILKEILSNQELQRKPEPDLVMDSPDAVAAFHAAGLPTGPMASTYLFAASHISATISGSKNILDLGCGSGQLLARVARANPKSHFTGVDLSSTMLKHAENLLADMSITNVTLKSQDMTRLQDFADHSFDAVISSLAFHHLPSEGSLELSFKEILRVLKPNGSFFLFDMSLVKTMRAIDYLIVRGGLEHPKVFIEDSINSMKAAFPFPLYEDLAKKILPRSTLKYTTFLFPFLTVLKSPGGRLDPDQQKHFKDVLDSLAPNIRNNYTDIVTLFSLNGLKSPIK